MRDSRRNLVVVLLVFAAASLVHFIHNAEFLADYPNLPRSWVRGDIYLAWAGITAVGLFGWLLMTRVNRFLGLAVLAVYAMCGLDSLGHYVLAPISQHTLAMNGTILLEVTAAGLVLVEIARQCAHEFFARARTSRQ
jgi:hypothetical protein